MSEAIMEARQERDSTVESAVRSAMRPPDKRPVWKWCEDHLVLDDSSALSAGQKWRSDASPWSRRIMDAFQNPRVRRITVRCAAQTAKTQTILGILCWIIANDPGPALWVTASREDVGTFIKNRVAPTFARCKPVAKLMRPVGEGTEKGNYQFEGMTFELVGAGSPSKLQSRPIKYLFLDECRNYPEGALEMAQKRTRTYEKLGAKTIIITTGDEEGDAVDVEYKNGTQETWRYPCMGCGKDIPLAFGDVTGESQPMMRWGNANDAHHLAFKDEKGRWDFDKLAPTIRHECPHCSHAHYDTPEVRRHIERSGQLVSENPKAPEDHVSVTYPSMLAGWVSWRSSVEEFIKAMGSLKFGNISPLKTWVNETNGESWSDKLKIFKTTERLEHLRGTYSLGADMPGEVRRFMGCDRQARNGDHYWYSIRAFAADGESRLIAYGQIHAGPGLEERVDEIRVKYAVQKEDCLVDSGYKALDTYRACVRFGWKPFKGDDKESYLVREKTGKMVRKLWLAVFPPEYHKIAGRASRLILWSNNGYKNTLAHLLTGTVGKWTIAEDTDDDYCKQLMAEERREFTVGNKSVWKWVKIRDDDHLRDCELQILVAALERGLVSIAVDLPTTEADAAAEESATSQ